MDTHPEKIEFEIDRDGLRRSLRAGYRTAWAIFFAVMMMPGGMVALARGLEGGISSGLRCLAYWIAGAGAICCAGYFAGSRKTLNRRVETVSLKVEGPYLLVQSYEVPNGSWHDRKLHFKSIVDYGIIEDSNMRRHGIQSLNLTTLAGGKSSDILIPAVRNCEQVRDLLSEIDHARENATPL